MNGSLSFTLPNGWNNLKCRSATYPDFRQDPCICPGDDGVTQELHKEILNLCYEEEKPQINSFMSVPMKKRCGVGALNNITKENICYCTERTSGAAGIFPSYFSSTNPAQKIFALPRTFDQKRSCFSH